MTLRAGLERVLRNVEARVSVLERILPTLATRQDLERFATKQDLERFATKEDLRAGLEEQRRLTLTLHEDVKSDIRLLAEHVARLYELVSARLN